MTSPEIRSPAPTALESRIQTLDVARGFALFGILLMNITAFGMPYQAYGDPTVWGGATGNDLRAWITTTMFFEGTQRGIFSMLFGAGALLLASSLERSSRPHASDAYFRRNLWLIFFGLVHAYALLWFGEILFPYGFGALVIYGFRNLPARRLMTIGVVMLAVQSGWDLVETRGLLAKHAPYVTATEAKTRGDSLTAEQTKAIGTWEGIEKNFKGDSAGLAANVKAHQGSYAEQFKLNAKIVGGAQPSGIYRWFLDVLGMMLIGMAFLKLGLFTFERPSRIYVMMAGLGYAVGLTVNYFEVAAILRAQFSVQSFLETAATYNVGRLAMTVGHLGLLLLFVRSGWLGFLQRAMAAVGRMAFSNYIMHSIICAVLFSGFGFGLYGELSRLELYYVVFSIWAFQVVASPLWLGRYRFGPLEWGWRWLTYGERPAMR